MNTRQTVNTTRARRKWAWTLRLAVLAGAALLAAAAAAGPADAGATVTPFTAHITVLGLVEPGTWWYADGVEHVRGLVEQECVDSATDARVTGLHTTIMNWNAGANAYTSWGTFHIDVGTCTTASDFVSAGGSWAGSWHWTPGSGAIEIVGHGSGTVAGLRLSARVTSYGSYWLVDGAILDPGRSE